MRILALLVLILSLSSVATEVVGKYNERVANEQARLAARAGSNEVYFGIYGDYGDERPLQRVALSFLSLLALVALRNSMWRLLSAAATAASFGIIILWLIRASRAIWLNWKTFGQFSFSDLLLIVANPVDYVLFVSIAVLLTWQLLSLAKMWLVKE